MTKFKTIDGLLLRDMALAGGAVLEKNREVVDALNVFPVPDGDTGTNMTLTMQSAIREINGKEYLRADEAANALAKGALRGARGNSGVIMSQLLRGFAKSLAGIEKITPREFAQALKTGSELAYKAVMKPKEGTILTVARVIAEEAVRQAEKDPDDYDALMTVIVKSGENILKKTTDMLPALKQAGVVDSGGKGLLLIYTGYASVVKGDDASAAAALTDGAAEAAEADCHDLTQNLTYTYCVSFDISSFRDDLNEHDVDSFRRRLNRIGDCVQVTGDMERVHVHVHTDNPGTAVEYGIELGELTEIVINNLADMKRKLELEEAAKSVLDNEPVEPEKQHGMVAVSMGDGFSEIFSDLSVDRIVEGGQTMNPSVNDLLDAIHAVNASCVFIFPNNGNVIFAANQAAELSDKNVYVIPTKNVAMGIAAAIAFQADVQPTENVRKMTEAAEHVKTATVTYAIRDSEYNGVQIARGDIIGLHNGQIEYCGSEIHAVLIDMLNGIMTEEEELITIYYGADVTQEEAEKLADELAELYPDCDVECHRGGQPLYYYLISLE